MGARAAKPSAGAARQIAAGVELIVLDVDGVMTDGSIVIDDLGHETKCFHVRDGFGIKLWQRLGFHVAIITGRTGRAVVHRARELAITLVVQGAGDKWAELQRILARIELKPVQVACIGDDWPELGLMRKVGLPIAVADADERVRAAAAWTTKAPGGRGAVREAIERLIEAKGRMDQAAGMYDDGHDGA